MATCSSRRASTLEIWEDEATRDYEEYEHVCDTLVALASIFVLGGSLADGFTALEHALRIAVEIRQPHDLALVEIIETLASFYARKGDAAKEKDLRLDAMARRVKALGEDHVAIPEALFALANRFLARGDYDDAERTYRRAVAICERVHGPEHLVTGRALGGLADVLASRKDWVRSEELARRSLALMERGCGTTDIHLAIGHQQLGVALLGLGDAALAATHFAKALEIAERYPRFPRQNVEGALEKWLQALEQLGRPKDAARVKARLDALRAAKNQ